MKTTIRTILLLICTLMVSNLHAQSIRVQGKVTYEDQPVSGVNIVIAGETGSIGTTDESGNFSVIAPRDGRLRFTHVSYETKTVLVRGRHELNVQLVSGVTELQEITITSNIKDKVMPEPTDIEIEGNFFHLRTRFPVPAALFHSNHRLVIQPFIYDVHDGTSRSLRPLVFDGKEYNATQTRMYYGHLEEDPLERFVRTKETPNGQNDLLFYHDSIFVENIEHDYRADVLLSIENYHRVLYTDSMTIARGTVNPMRMLEYRFEPLVLNDSTVVPRPEMQMHDTKGEIQLTYLIGKTELDPNNPENEQNIEKLVHEISQIAYNPDASIQNITVTGVASPDGYPEANSRLAEQRAATALDRIQDKLGDLARYANFVPKGEVALWDSVAAMLKADQNIELSNRVKALLKQCNNDPYRTYRALKSKPGFDVIAKEYLPKLRRVSYEYNYSVLRHLNREEVLALYAKDPKKLTRYEYFLLSLYARNEEERVKYMEDALKTYDRFLYAANELAQIRIRQGRPDDKLLEPYVDKGTPHEILCNHITALLNRGRYSEAQRVLEVMGYGKCDPMMESIVLAMNGEYEEAAPLLCQDNPTNEVIFMLANKDNQGALDLVRTLDQNNAKILYLHAMAANRTDNLGEALSCLEKALELDPALLEIAKVDGDVLDLLPKEEAPFK